MSLINFIAGGMIATMKPAGEEGRRRETIRRAWFPIKTNQGLIWLSKYFYVEEYQLVQPYGPFGARVFGWVWIENNKYQLRGAE